MCRTSTSTPFFLSGNGVIYELGFVNEKIRGKIKVIKTDGNTTTPLQGVMFEVFDAKGKLAAALAMGTAATVWPEYGKYTVKEKSTLSGFILEGTVHTIEIAGHKKVYKMRVKNNRVREPPKPPEPPPKTPASPKTGDDSSPALWFALLGISAAALAGFGVYRKLKNIIIREEHSNGT